MGTAPPTQRRQHLIERLTALLPSGQAFRRWLRVRTSLLTQGNLSEKSASTAKAGPPKEPPVPPPAPLPPPPPPPQPSAPPIPRHDPPTGDLSAPVGYLLPGMRPQGSSPPAITHDGVDNTQLPDANAQTLPMPVPCKPHVPKPSAEPDLLLSKLPVDILVSILELPQLSLYDLLALRTTCRTLRGALPFAVMERKLTVQNYAGWKVVFEMGGHRYPGTTYGNRRLCGRCVVPKIRGHLIAGEAVAGFLERRRREEGGGEGEEEWPWERGMCFPCLWTVLAPAGEMGGEMEEMARRAGIPNGEQFRMMDGTFRRICERCKRDIHENAVPCPHCTDFSEWCRTRHLS